VRWLFDGLDGSLVDLLVGKLVSGMFLFLLFLLIYMYKRFHRFGVSLFHLGLSYFYSCSIFLLYVYNNIILFKYLYISCV
jgi:hypothetical protein